MTLFQAAVLETMNKRAIKCVSFTAPRLFKLTNKKSLINILIASIEYHFHQSEYLDVVSLIYKSLFSYNGKSDYLQWGSEGVTDIFTVIIPRICYSFR